MGNAFWRKAGSTVGLVIMALVFDIACGFFFDWMGYERGEAAFILACFLWAKSIVERNTGRAE